MLDSNVGVMLFSLMQNLVFLMGQACVVDTEGLYLRILLAVLKQAQALYLGSEDFRRVTKALVEVSVPGDMLQKALAHVLLREDKWTRPKRLRTLRVVLQRSSRHGEMMASMRAGVLGLFFVIPELRRFLWPASDRPVSMEDVSDAFRAAEREFLTAHAEQYVEVTEGRQTMADFVNTSVHLLCKFTDMPIAEASAAALMKFVGSVPSPAMNEDFDWVAAGELPPPPTPAFSIVHKPAFRVTTQKRGDFGSAVDVEVVGGDGGGDGGDGTRVRLTTASGVNWGAVGLHDTGTYKVTMDTLGCAEQVGGDTRHVHGVANVRVTRGTVILPDDKEGYSPLTGMCLRRISKASKYSKNVFEYVPSDPFPDIARDGFELHLHPSGSYTLSSCTGKVLFVPKDAGAAPLSAGNPVLLAFKNVSLQVEFSPFKTETGAGAGAGAGAGPSAGPGAVKEAAVSAIIGKLADSLVLRDRMARSASTSALAKY
jgi:hypothetical protein